MIKILIAEDEPLSLQNLIGHLRRCLGTDALIEGVSNGREAVERARQIQPALIFMDIEMPIMNGLDAASILHQNQPELPIIFLTAFDRFDYAVGASWRVVRTTCSSHLTARRLTPACGACLSYQSRTQNSRMQPKIHSVRSFLCGFRTIICRIFRSIRRLRPWA